MTIFICTTEDSGIDRYSQGLAQHLPVPVVQTRRYKLGLKGYSLVRKIGSDNELVHFPSQHFGRYAVLAGHPFVVTVHDLERICFPLTRDSLKERIGLRLDVLAIKKARHVIAVSQNTKRDLVRLLGVEEDNVTVVYNGVDHNVFRQNGSTPAPYRYVLYVGSERPRKNLGRLIEAFARLKQSGRFNDLKLVKVGAAGRSPAFRKASLRAIKDFGLEDEVIFTEHVSDQELASYYWSASALVYPSLYEGFGLPVLEAMACGCPVITSNTSSLPEVAGEAALLVDPYDVSSLCVAMERLLEDDQMKRRLAAQGVQRSKRFSWALSATETMGVYRQAETC